MASKTTSPKTSPKTSAKTSAKIPVKTSKQSSAKTKTMISATVSAKVVSSPKKSSHKKVTSAKKSGAGTTSSTKTGITTKPLNPIQVDRMQCILDYIKSKKSAGVSKEELLDWCDKELDLSKSSVMEYLKLIKDVWKEPIETELVTGSHYQKVAWYFYRPGTQYVPSVQDITTVKNAFIILKTMLDQHKAISIDDVEDGLLILKDWFENKNKTVERDTIIFNDYIQHATTEYFSRTGRVSDIYEYIIAQEILEITYKSFDGEKYIFEFHPHALRCYNQRWYVFGYNPQEKTYNWFFSLDRIESIKSLGNRDFRPSVITDWKELFDSFIGVSNVPNIVKTQREVQDRTQEEASKKKPSNRVFTTWKNFMDLRSKLELRIDTTAKNLLESKPIFPEQDIKPDPENHGYYILTSKCFLNVELESTILRFGEQVEVVKPKELRSRLKTRLSKAASHY